MVHCNPASPHPEPGTLIKAVCPPSLTEIGIFLAVITISIIFIRYFASKIDTQGKEEASQ